MVDEIPQGPLRAVAREPAPTPRHVLPIRVVLAEAPSPQHRAPQRRLRWLVPAVLGPALVAGAGVIALAWTGVGDQAGTGAQGYQPPAVSTGPSSSPAPSAAAAPVAPTVGSSATAQEVPTVPATRAALDEPLLRPGGVGAVVPRASSPVPSLPGVRPVPPGVPTPTPTPPSTPTPTPTPPSEPTPTPTPPVDPTPTPTPPPPAPGRVGDIDGNGAVDCADLAILKSDYGSGAARSDLDGDGKVGPRDFAILVANLDPGVSCR